MTQHKNKHNGSKDSHNTSLRRKKRFLFFLCLCLCLCHMKCDAVNIPARISIRESSLCCFTVSRRYETENNAIIHSMNACVLVLV